MKDLKKLISMILVIVLAVSMIPLSTITAGAEEDDFPEITVGESIPTEREIGSHFYRFVPKESGWYMASVTGYLIMYSGINVLLWDSSKEEYVESIDTRAGYPELSYWFEADTEYLFLIMVDHRLYYPYYFTVEKSAPATGVSIVQGDAVTKPADSAFSMSARLAPNNAIPEAYTWTSSDESVATVDQNGDVSCIAPGKSTVTVTTENGLTASCEVTVIEVESISDGESKTVRNKEEVGYCFVPPTDGMYYFSSRGQSVFLSLYDAQMDPIVDDLTSSICMELNAGETYYLKAQADLWGDEDDYEYEISVQKMIPATGIIIDQGDRVSAYEWRSITLSAKLMPENAISEGYTWTSSDEDIATVDQDGKVSCIKPGKATVTVTTENGLTASCEVTVKEIPVLTEGEMQTIAVNAYPQEDYFSFTPEESGTYRFYCESDSCESMGRLYDANMQPLFPDSGNQLWLPLKAGTPYFLKVFSYPWPGEDFDEFSFTVGVERMVSATGVVINQGDSVSVYERQSVNLTAALTPKNAISEGYTWTSSDEDIATVDQDGKVSCIKPGKATVTVTTENGLTASCEVTVKGVPTLIENEPQNGELTADSPEAYYVFIPEKSGTYLFTCSSDDFYDDIDLYDSDMELLYTSSYGRYLLDGGATYYLKITSWDAYGSFTVGVKKVKGVRLEPVSPPDHTVYPRNLVWDEFDGSGMSVRICWDDGTEDIWRYEDSEYYQGDYVYRDIDEETGVLTLSYLGAKTEFQLTLTDDPVDHIEIDSAPTTEYDYGDHRYSYSNINYDNEITFRWNYDGRSVALEPEGLVFTVYYVDGTTKQYTWEDINSGRIDGYTYSFEADDHIMKSGDNPFTLRYMDHTADFAVKVKESDIKSIEIIKAPDNPVFLASGYCSPDFKGMTLRIRYQDDSGRDVTFDDDNLPISTGANEVPFTVDGKQGTIIRTGMEDFLIVYQGLTCEVDCLEPQQPQEVERVIIESFSPETGKLTATVNYSNDTVETITIEKAFGPFKMGPNSYRYCGRCSYGLLNINYATLDGKAYNVWFFGQEIEYHVGEERILGDADGDGEITSLDVTYLQRFCAQLETDVDLDTLMQGDVDGNGILEIVDATFIQRYIAEMEIPYSIG